MPKNPLFFFFFPPKIQNYAMSHNSVYGAISLVHCQEGFVFQVNCFLFFYERNKNGSSEIGEVGEGGYMAYYAFFLFEILFFLHKITLCHTLVRNEVLTLGQKTQSSLFCKKGAISVDDQGEFPW